MVNKWLQSLHEHFIPSKRNAYQPHFLRMRIVAGILGAIFLLEGIYLVVSFVVLPGSGYLAAIFSSVLIEQTNEARVDAELHGLTVSEQLTLAAQLKANDMAEKGYFAHVAPDGTTPWHWFREAGYQYAAAGENLAVNFVDSRDVTNAWLRSPTHRANIMNGTYTEIGIATAQGTYKGREAVFVVQEFGRPTPSSLRADFAPDAPVVAPPPSLPPVSTPTTPPSPVLGATSVPELVEAPVVEQPSDTPPPSSPTRYAVTTPTPRTATSVAAVAGVNTEGEPLLTSTQSQSGEAPTSLGVVGTLLASPRMVTERVLVTLGVIVFLALLLAVFVHYRVQFPHLIMNGVLLIAIIVALLLLNSALGLLFGDI